MQIPFYHIDAFSRVPFAGNPAAVCLLEDWINPDLMQNIAAEYGLSETAFVVEQKDGFAIRWFSPRMEIDLCGHATLAAAQALILNGSIDQQTILFHSSSGVLQVDRELDGSLTMHLPLRTALPCTPPALLEVALGVEAMEILASRDYLVILRNEAQVRAVQPNMALLSEVKNCLGVIITAAGDDVDFVSRFFYPNAGITEDPVTGSAHCTLTPYWAERLGKTQLRARQVSRRGGELECELANNKVLISGHATLFTKGHLHLNTHQY